MAIEPASILRLPTSVRGRATGGLWASHSVRNALMLMNAAPSASRSPLLATTVGQPKLVVTIDPPGDCVEVIRKHPARQRLAALAQLFMQTAPVGCGKKPARAIGALANALIATPPGDGLERVATVAFDLARVGAKPSCRVVSLQRRDLSGRHQDLPAAATARAARAGEALFRIDAKGSRQTSAVYSATQTGGHFLSGGTLLVGRELLVGRCP